MYYSTESGARKRSIKKERENNKSEIQRAGQMMKISEKPEVLVKQNVYPGTIIEIGKRVFSIKHESQGVFMSDTELSEIEAT